MKKTILVALMAVMIATPCFAQKAEPDGIFTLDGTLWRTCEILFTSNEPDFQRRCDTRLGFYQGHVYYFYEEWYPLANYINLGAVSIAWEMNIPFVSYYLAIIQPAIGFGVLTWADGFCWTTCVLTHAIGMMFKIDDNWTPPEVE